MLSVKIKSIMPNIITLSVFYAECHIMLNIVMLSVIMLNVVVRLKCISLLQNRPLKSDV